MEQVKKFVGTKVRVTTSLNRVVVGNLTCFDAEGNMLFRHVAETITVGSETIQREVANMMVPGSIITKVETLA